VIQMINHGLSTGALFLAVGIIYERRHTREISEFGGIAEILPWFAAFFLIICLSSLGLPGLNGFIGEFLILLGAFRVHPKVAALAATGVILAAVYLLWMYQRVMFGPVTNEKNRGLRDLSPREFWTLVPVLLMILWLGIYPNTFLRKLDGSVGDLVARMGHTMAQAKEPGDVTPAAAVGRPGEPVVDAVVPTAVAGGGPR